MENKIEIKDLVINGIRVKDRDITYCVFPRQDSPFWTFITSENTYIYATGNVSFESIEGAKK